MPSPEEFARENIDKELDGCGWKIQRRSEINLTDIKAYIFPFPPTAEQTRVVAEAERRPTIVEEMRFVANLEVQRASPIRPAILNNAFAHHQ